MFYREHAPAHFHAIYGEFDWSNPMPFRLIHARQIQGFVLRLKFSDGVEGEIDLRDELDGPIFEPLKNLEVFKQFRIDPDLHTLVWPNGADFSPEFLHDNVRVPA